MQKKDPFFPLISYLLSPIITYPNYEDEAKEFEKLVKEERMLRIMKALKNNEEINEATDIEALIYLYTTSLAIPLSNDWCEIYFWLIKQCLFLKNNKEIPEDLDFINVELDEYQKQLLKELKRWIYKVQQRYLFKKLKNEDSKDSIC